VVILVRTCVPVGIRQAGAVAVNFRQIQCFKAVMETGTVTAAAERLGVSQPAASKALAGLEHDLGFKLFDRRRGRLEPTAEARALYEEVERVFSHFAYIRDFAKELGQFKRGRLVVAAMPALCHSWLPRAVARFLDGRDQLSLSIETRSSLKVVEYVAAQQVDIGIAMLPLDDPAVVSEPLMRIPGVAVLPDGHAKCGKPVLGPEDFRNERFVSLSTLDRSRVMIDSVFEAAGVPRRLFVEAALGNVACALVREGQGVSIVDAISANEKQGPGIVVRPFRPRIEFVVQLLRPLQRPRSHIADAFVDALRSYIASEEPAWSAAAS
jgi:DNA-binding transcriptional LysR family regulator